MLHGALATATRRVCIVTPYFLPDRVLIAALRLAALRGVRVDVVLPEKSNLRFVQWAATAQLPSVDGMSGTATGAISTTLTKRYL